ncbi:MAG: hypothetical protein AAGA54_05860 [Myxococcota bacterium]
MVQGLSWLDMLCEEAHIEQDDVAMDADEEARLRRVMKRLRAQVELDADDRDAQAQRRARRARHAVSGEIIT